MSREQKMKGDTTGRDSALSSTGQEMFSGDAKRLFFTWCSADFPRRCHSEQKRLRTNHPRA